MEAAPGDLVIVGAGGHGREALDLIEALGWRSSFVGFVDDHEPDAVAASRLAARSASIVGDVTWLGEHDLHYVLAIGTSAVRRTIAGRLDAAGRAIPASVVHPTASVGSVVVRAPGSFIGALTVITTNVSIGRHSHVNAGCAVQHDSTVGEFVTISPGVFVNGDVTIGDDVFIGTGAVITRGLTIGNGAVIGAGAVVLRDVAPGESVRGIPARPAAGG